jgi:signal transduction histidine kinase
MEELNIFKKILIIVLLLIIVSILDLITGNEFSFSLFYLLPIIFAGWYISRNAGIIVSILSAMTWFTVEWINDGTAIYTIIPYWNAIVRFGFFICIIFLINLIKKEREREKDIIHFIAHDLKSPLGSILTGLNMLQAEDQPLTRREKQIFDLSIGSGNRMLMFIDSLVDLGRMQKKYMPVNLKIVNILEVIKEAKNLLKNLAEVNDIEIRIICSEKIIYTDENLLLRIIMNLLNNAIKVSDHKSIIEIKAEEPDEKYIRFSVTDQGPGMPKIKENKLFEKFNVDKIKTSGSGVGLSFCKYAVELLGGEIEIKSDEGKGTVVSFTLPQS